MLLPLNPLPLGLLTVATPGTLVQLTSNCQTLYGKTFYNTSPSGTNGQEDLWAADVLIRAVPANAGSIYLGYKTMIRATGAGVIAIIAKGDPPFKLSEQQGANKIRVGDLYVDSDNGTDGCYASAFVWG